MASRPPAPPDQDRYADALAGADPVESMAETPGKLRRLVRGLTEKQLATKPAPGKWSIREIVGHLLDNEVVLGSRYRFIAAMDRPPIPGFDQDAFVANLGVSNARTIDLLDDFGMARAVNLGLLQRLGKDAWSRVGIHSERGEESFGDLVATYAGHDLHHLAQIETIRTGLFPRAGRPRRRAGKRAAR